MKKIHRPVLIILFFLFVLSASGAENQTSIAVYPIKAVREEDKANAAVLTSLMINELAKSSKLIVLEEAMLKKVMETQGLNTSDACDDTTCQVEVGKLVKTQNVLVCDLSKLGSRWLLTIKVTSIQTRAVVFSDRQECTCTEDTLDQLVAAAALKIRTHFGETGLEPPPPPPPPTESETALGARVPSPAQLGTGYLAIATTPDKADILLDAENKGKTPQTLKVPAGSHSLTLTKSGYSPSMQEIEIKPNQTVNVSLALLKQTGALDISTTPAGAQIFLDDKYQGTSPKKVEGILTGKHKVKAQLDNYQAAEQEASVDFQQTTPVALALSGLPGKFLILSVPEGAEVRIDGEKKGVTAATGLSGSLPAGQHRVEVSKEGYEGASEEIEIAPNMALSKSYTLKKYSGPGGKKGGPMVFVPAGEFTMGLSADTAVQECQKYYNDCRQVYYDDHEPAHRVYLDVFYIDKYEVTQGDYNQCVREGKCKDNKKYASFASDRQPVVGVSWNQANSYCAWAGKRLPTEAEWEKAARGTDSRIYPWGNKFDGTKLNFCDKNCENKYWAEYKVFDPSAAVGYIQTAPVGSYPNGASPYGALDMAGNASEWVADWFDEKYYSNSPLKNPKGPSSGKARVLRGRSWYFGFTYCSQAAYRYNQPPDFEDDHSGFRCAGD